MLHTRSVLEGKVAAMPFYKIEEVQGDQKQTSKGVPISKGVSISKTMLLIFGLPESQ